MICPITGRPDVTGITGRKNMSPVAQDIIDIAV